MTLRLDRWPRKTTGHIFYATSCFDHHHIAICEFKLELQFRNAHFWSKLSIFRPVWPWNLTDVLRNNREPLVCHFDIYAAFLSHLWIQTRCYGPETPKLGQHLFWPLWTWPLTSDLDLFPLTSLFSMVITPNDVMMIDYINIVRLNHHNKATCELYIGSSWRHWLDDRNGHRHGLLTE